MNSKDCLTEQELTLHYYGELDASRSRHLADCQLCMENLGTLTTDLAGLPKPDCTPDALAGVRMAARVNEQLTSRRRWLPAFGAGAVAALALVVTFSYNPQPEPVQVTLSSPSTVTSMSLEEDMPEIDFLEDIELLKELELLSQIEGV